MEEVSKGYIIITGASGSMGKIAAAECARRGYPVILACRNIAKGEAVRAGILAEMPDAQVRVCKLDLGSMQSVRSFASEIEGLPLSGLFNNAGTMNRRFGLSEDGIERTMAVNYVGPYLLTRLLLDRFSPDAHIVNMVSVTCKLAKIDEKCLAKGKKDFHQLRTYASSKLALMMFSIALAKRCPLHVNMADPGVVNSNMIHMDRWFDPLADVLFRPLCKRPEDGVKPALAALQADCSMKIFVGNKIKDVPSRIANNPLIDELWDITEKIYA